MRVYILIDKGRDSISKPYEYCYKVYDMPSGPACLKEAQKRGFFGHLPDRPGLMCQTAHGGSDIAILMVELS